MGLRFDNIPLSAYDGIIRKLFGHLNLQDKMNHYECVCPFCGDMKQAHKRKLWIYKDTWKTTCFKGCFDGSLLKLLQENYPDEYHELITYAITDDDNRTGGTKPAEKPLVQRVVPTLPFCLFPTRQIRWQKRPGTSAPAEGSARMCMRHGLPVGRANSFIIATRTVPSSIIRVRRGR